MSGFYDITEQIDLVQEQQELAELAVLESLLDVYTKQQAIMEQTDCDPSIFSVFQEANELMVLPGQKAKDAAAATAPADAKPEEKKGPAQGTPATNSKNVRSTSSAAKFGRMIKRLIMKIQEFFSRKFGAEHQYNAFIKKVGNKTAVMLPMSREYLAAIKKHLKRVGKEVEKLATSADLEPSKVSIANFSKWARNIANEVDTLEKRATDQNNKFFGISDGGKVNVSDFNQQISMDLFKEIAEMSIALSKLISESSKKIDKFLDTVADVGKSGEGDATLSDADWTNISKMVDRFYKISIKLNRGLSTWCKALSAGIDNPSSVTKPDKVKKGDVIFAGTPAKGDATAAPAEAPAEKPEEKKGPVQGTPNNDTGVPLQGTPKGGPAAAVPAGA